LGVSRRREISRTRAWEHEQATQRFFFLVLEEEKNGMSLASHACLMFPKQNVPLIDVLG
jgi:hypothetical protein